MASKSKNNPTTLPPRPEKINRHAVLRYRQRWCNEPDLDESKGPDHAKAVIALARFVLNARFVEVEDHNKQAIWEVDHPEGRLLLVSDLTGILLTVLPRGAMKRPESMIQHLLKRNS